MMMRRLAAAAQPRGLGEAAKRFLVIRKENYFSEEAISHSRRVSWSPHTTAKKQGAFAKLSRSNFNDPLPTSQSLEPYVEETVEAHRSHQQPDVYIYKYNVSPTNMSLRP